MLSREEIEQRECDLLAPYAVKSRYTKGRQYPEAEHPYRGVFQRDKDRIIFSAAFRRLQYKTQVFSNFEGDHYRTRLTHTLEVSHIARAIARSLRLNEDLSEAIALAHDVGHGPFGHIGEQILNECMMPYGGFEHNRHSLRVVDELEDIYALGKGLNLAFETKEGLKKHSFSPSGGGMPDSYVFLEAQVVDVADEIAYDSHDVDDGMNARLFTERDVRTLSIWGPIEQHLAEHHPDAPPYQRVRLGIRYLINTQVTDLLMETERRLAAHHITSLDEVGRSGCQLVDMSDAMRRNKKELKEFLMNHFYRNPHVMKIVAIAERCIRNLFDWYVASPELMPQHFAQKVTAAGMAAPRIVCDYIAGMTDRYAYEEFERIGRTRGGDEKK